MSTELFVGEGGFEAMAAEWDALAARGMTDTPVSYTHLDVYKRQLYSVL